MLILYSKSGYATKLMRNAHEICRVYANMQAKGILLFFNLMTITPELTQMTRSFRR